MIAGQAAERPGGLRGRAIDDAVQRLRDRYPAIGPDRIHAVVVDALRVLDGGPIRDFEPVFVERAALGTPFSH